MFYIGYGTNNIQKLSTGRGTVIHPAKAPYSACHMNLELPVKEVLSRCGGWCKNTVEPCSYHIGLPGKS